MSVNWEQVGTDFKQKYEGCFCRYESPINAKKEVFQLIQVVVSGNKPPDLTLFNKRAGELFLTYSTEAELDFMFPEVGYFQHGKEALLFGKRYERQWKKGINEGTARIDFPYNDVFGGFAPREISCESLESAFLPQPTISLSMGMAELTARKWVSVVLGKQWALGCGKTPNVKWLWFDSEPVAEVEGNQIRCKVEPFNQEIKDYLRMTGEHGYLVV
jgi:hypothetical protein